MKKFLRLGIIAVIILAIAAGIIVTAIVNNKGGQREEEHIDDDLNDVSGDLSIRLWEGGYGVGWLDNVIKGFKAKFPNVKVSYKASSERQVVVGEITAGSDKYDLYFNESDLFTINGFKPQEALEPLDDVYSYKWTGEDRTIAEKMDDSFLSFYKIGEHQYMINQYAGCWGFAYNIDYIGDDEIPVTTEELKSLCVSLKTNGITPLIFFEKSYWDYAYYNWFAQYEGREAFDLYQIGKIINGENQAVYDPSAAYPIGELKALQVCEDLLWLPYGNIAEQSTGYQFIVAQKKLLDGDVAMMFNGSWMLNEMQDLYPEGKGNEFRIMKVPVISAITDKCATIENDAELSALIRAIDAGETALSGEGYNVSQADFDRVKEARNLVYCSGESATGVITKSAHNKQLAKLFLKYMYSDEGLKLYLNAKNGAMLPVKGYDELIAGLDLEEFERSAYNVILGSNRLFVNHKDMLISLDCHDLVKVNTIERQFGSQEPSDRTRASVSYNAKKDTYSVNSNKKYWDILRNNGLID